MLPKMLNKIILKITYGYFWAKMKSSNNSPVSITASWLEEYFKHHKIYSSNFIYQQIATNMTKYLYCTSLHAF